MYCQSCGASNSDDAKFCNQCGGRIAQPGDVGGPAAKSPGATVVGVGAPVVAPPSAPATSQPAGGVNVWEQQATTGAGGGPSMMSVSLDAIGVRSTKRVWAGIVIVALLLVALGALGSWLLRGEPEVVAEAGHAQPEDPFVIGTPLPSGDEVPVEAPTTDDGAEPSSMSGATTMSGGSAPTRSTAMDTSGSMATSTAGSTTMTGSTTTMEPATTGSTTMNTTTTMDTSTGATTMDTSTGTTTMDTSTGTTTMDTTESPTTMDTSGGTNLGGELPEERDLELELYGSRVRFVVQRYYAARAQGCFDRATRNNPNVSGTVVVSMTIGSEGAVTDTRIVRNTTGDEVLGNCLRSQVASWQLPPPPGGSLEMQMPFSR